MARDSAADTYVIAQIDTMAGHGETAVCHTSLNVFLVFQAPIATASADYLNVKRTGCTMGQSVGESEIQKASAALIPAFTHELPFQIEVCHAST